MLPLLRANVGLSISLALLLGGALVCLLLALLMGRGGASLRPIAWFAGFFSLVVVPQMIGHLYRAVRTTQSEAPRTAALAQLADTARAPDAAGRDADARSLFGPDADPQLISDVRGAYGEVFAGAEFAQFAALPEGETVLLARFPSASAAEKAWVNYLRTAGLQSGGQGDSHRGYAVTRAVGDRAYALPFGTLLGVWTGKDDDAIRRRMAAGGFEVPARAPLAGVSPPAVAGSGVPGSSAAPAATLLRRLLLGAVIAVYALGVVLYYFKGSAWAGTTQARPNVPPVPAAELATRLESLNALDVPFQIERGTQPGEFFATWRYADARWMELARARGLRRVFRIRMVMDAAPHTVRATDYTATLDWSAGRGGADLQWRAEVGLVFFQYEHRRVFGLQWDEQGRFKPELSYTYTFDLKEMKSPLVETITRAGWHWRPTVWQGPAWLRWLTE